MKLIKSELEKRFEYCEDTGVLVWKTGRCRGKEAGWINYQGYRKVRLNGINVPAHRIIWVLAPAAAVEMALVQKDSAEVEGWVPLMAG